MLVIAGPLVPPSSEEAWQVRSFVARGGRLLITGVVGANLISAEVPDSERAHGEWPNFSAELPAPLTRNVPEIAMKNVLRSVHLPPGRQRYYGDRSGAVVIKYQIGKGEVIWWADDSPLTNNGLTRASNLTLLLNSVGWPAPTRVLWDEYFHGQRLGFWDYLWRGPVPWALLQLAVLTLFVVVTYGRRSGPVRPLSPESRLSPLEFVETLGALYERKRAWSGALEIAFHRFRFLVTRQLGLPAGAATADLIRGVHDRLGWKTNNLADTIERIDVALKTQHATETEALKWIGELFDFTHQLGLESGARGGKASP